MNDIPISEYPFLSRVALELVPTGSVSAIGLILCLVYRRKLKVAAKWVALACVLGCASPFYWSLILNRDLFLHGNTVIERAVSAMILQWPSYAAIFCWCWAAFCGRNTGTGSNPSLSEIEQDVEPQERH